MRTVCAIPSYHTFDIQGSDKDSCQSVFDEKIEDVEIKNRDASKKHTLNNPKNTPFLYPPLESHNHVLKNRLPSVIYVFIIFLLSPLFFTDLVQRFKFKLKNSKTQKLKNVQRKRQSRRWI